MLYQILFPNGSTLDNVEIDGDGVVTLPEGTLLEDGTYPIISNNEPVGSFRVTNGVVGTAGNTITVRVVKMYVGAEPPHRLPTIDEAIDAANARRRERQ